ncbi:MAG: CinA family protein [Treponema sp.]|jgi:PncC family amidohydrolase|nr:CinA family protein [Treponema sp.]
MQKVNDRRAAGKHSSGTRILHDTRAQVPSPKSQVPLESLAATLAARLAEQNKTLALAESCTAGLATALLAGVPGASRVLWGSYVTYTCEAKERMLAVPRALLERHGAVSAECACALARGALEQSGADLAAAVTGLAGPSGDGSETPVGTVWIACCRRGEEPRPQVFHFTGARNEVRLAAAEETLRAVWSLLENKAHDRSA